MARYECMICGHIYDEAEEGTSWDALPDDWSCPTCGAAKSQFKRVDEPATVSTVSPASTKPDTEFPVESSTATTAPATPVPVAPTARPARRRSNPRRMVFLHRVFGYVFCAIYLILLVQMIPRLWSYQVEFPARTVLHIALGIAVGTMLVLKISIVRFFRRLDPTLVPTLGIWIVVGSVVLVGISVPTALQEAFATAHLFTNENRSRVATLLQQAGLDQPSAARFSSVASLRAGQRVLRNKCITCHDLRLVLARPRTPANWHQTVQRMARRSTVATTISTDEQWQVTAYLVALSPELQETRQQLETEHAQQSKAQQAAANPPAQVSYDPNAAKQLFEAKCSQCHSSSLVAKMPPASATAASELVAKMVDEGLDASDTEIAQIIQYLTETYAKRVE